MKKDILRYFIDYCKNSEGVFNIEAFNRLLDRGFVLTNDKDEFEKPVDDIYILAETGKFNLIFFDYDIENFSERETDNGFENPGLIQLREAVGNGYFDGTFTERGMVELVTGNSKFLQYPELFTISEDLEGNQVSPAETFERILDRGVVINYDEEFNNIIISSIETWLKYIVAAAPTLPSNLKYSVTGDVEVEEAVAVLA